MNSENSSRLKTLKIKGFRSIKEFELNNMDELVVLHGNSATGKSNFVRFFEMLSWMLKGGHLTQFVTREGGADDQLFGGRGVNQSIEGHLAIETTLHRGSVGLNEYRFVLAYTHPDQFMFSEEAFRFSDMSLDSISDWMQLPGGGREARLLSVAHTDDFPGMKKTAAVVLILLKGCSSFQFNSFAIVEKLKSHWSIDDDRRMRGDAANLPALLYRLQEEEYDRFELICEQLGRFIPGFNRFVLEPEHGKLLLQWSVKGMDKLMSAHITSDTSLKLFALVTMLNFPNDMQPGVMILDEPDLGLNADGMRHLADLIREISDRKQVILTTRSSQFIEELDVDLVTSLDMVDGVTEFKHLDRDEFDEMMAG